ncbi:MAG: hypothetical protein EXR60_00750 [Dehalococcoidia bacterium]|nr:hypothetical protein [Dehalococcoidia bacterium]
MKRLWSLRRAEPAAPSVATASTGASQPAPDRAPRLSRQLVLGYGFALAAALSYAGAQIVVKHTVPAKGPSMVALLFSLAVGTGVLFLMMARESPSLLQVSKRKGILFLLLSGCFSALGVGLFYYTLSIAPVVVVSPLVGIHPLFAILFSYLFLRDLERVTLRLVLGALMVTAGVAVIAVSRLL